jgi:hypothetical protein
MGSLKTLLDNGETFGLVERAILIEIRCNDFSGV